MRRAFAIDYAAAPREARRASAPPAGIWGFVRASQSLPPILSRFAYRRMPHAPTDDDGQTLDAAPPLLARVIRLSHAISMRPEGWRAAPR